MLNIKFTNNMKDSLSNLIKTGMVNFLKFCMNSKHSFVFVICFEIKNVKSFKGMQNNTNPVIVKLFRTVGSKLFALT